MELKYSNSRKRALILAKKIKVLSRVSTLKEEFLRLHLENSSSKSTASKQNLMKKGRMSIFNGSCRAALGLLK